MAAPKKNETSLPEVPEMRLNQKQLFLIFLGGLVVMAMVFALGVMTGLNWKAQVKEVPQNELAALDKAAQHERSGGDPDELNEAAPKEDAGEAKSAKGGEENKAAPAEKKEEPQKPAEQAKKGTAPAKEKAAEKPVEKPKTKEVAVEPAEDHQSGLAQPPEVKNPRFTLQMSAVFSEAAAKKELAFIAKLGLKGFIQSKDMADGKTLYRVRIGTFADRPTIDSFKEQFDKASGRQTMVVNY